MLSGTSGSSPGGTPSPAPEETFPHAAVSDAGGNAAARQLRRKGCEVLVGTKLNTTCPSQPRGLMPCCLALGRVLPCREGGDPLYSAFVRLRLERHIQFWALQYKRDRAIAESSAKGPED